MADENASDSSEEQVISNAAQREEAEGEEDSFSVDGGTDGINTTNIDSPQNISSSGICGDNVTWQLNDEGLLSIMHLKGA